MTVPDNDTIYGVFNQKFGGRIRNNRLFRELYDSHVELADAFRARVAELEAELNDAHERLNQAKQRAFLQELQRVTGIGEGSDL